VDWDRVVTRGIRDGNYHSSKYAAKVDLESLYALFATRISILHYTQAARNGLRMTHAMVK
jgi:hypothetical protein